MAVRLTVETRDRYRWVSLAAGGLPGGRRGDGRFGLPPIDLHAPLHWYRIMDRLCGGTRAALHTALGHWGEVWRHNPLGLVTVLLAGLLLVRGVVGLVTGRWPTVNVSWTRRARWIAIRVATALIVLLEIRQPGRGELRMSNTFTFVDHHPS